MSAEHPPPPLSPSLNRRDFMIVAGSAAAVGLLFPAARAQNSAATSGKIKAVAFDAFPILDPRPVFARAEEFFPGRGADLSNLWRTRQFEYTWLRTAAERYQNFWQVTQDALNYAGARMGLHLSGEQRDNLMNAYHELAVWPDVRDSLADLRAHGIRMAFLSNFTADMISSNLNAAGLGRFFEKHLTTDQVRAFKPSPRAYQMGIDHFRCRREEIAFAAFAPWDAAGAKWFGYRTLWINRARAPLEELSITPDFVAPTLSDPELLSHLLSGPKKAAPEVSKTARS